VKKEERFIPLGKNVVQMVKKVPSTRFPDAVAVQYYRDIKKLIQAMGKVTLDVFDGHIKPRIKLYKSRQDSRFYSLDSPPDIIRQAIETMKGLSLGIFSANEVLNTATRFINSLNVFKKRTFRIREES